jgi:hypothetical protein
MVLSAAAEVPVSPRDNHIVAARCRREFLPGEGQQYMGRADWQDTSTHGIVGATGDRTSGESILFCTVKLPAAATSAVLDFTGARVSFTGGSTEAAPDGFELRLLPGKIDSPKSGEAVCTLAALRMSLETWIELGPARYNLPFGHATDRLTLILRLADLSTTGATRVDIGGMKIRAAKPGETLTECPPGPG